MEQDYWDNVKNFRDKTADYFNVVSKNEKDLMNQTKNFAQRVRLGRDIDFTEDFRKRFMTRDYGNYEKYEKNTITEEVEKGSTDNGLDTFWKNNNEMLKRLKSLESERKKENDNAKMEDLLTNTHYADQTIDERFRENRFDEQYVDEIKRRDDEIKLMRNFQLTEIQYNGRMSPEGKEEVYRNY